MDTKKVIVTLLILAMILSVLTIAFNMSLKKGTIIINKRGSTDQATVGLYVEGEEKKPAASTNDNANVGLYVSS